MERQRGLEQKGDLAGACIEEMLRLPIEKPINMPAYLHFFSTVNKVKQTREVRKK